MADKSNSDKAEGTGFEQFANLTKRLLAVPKRELDARRAAERQAKSDPQPRTSRTAQPPS